MRVNTFLSLLLALSVMAAPATRPTAEAGPPAAKFAAAPKTQIEPLDKAAVTLVVPDELQVKRGRFKLFKPETNGKVTFLLPEGDVLDVLPYLDGQFQVSGDEGTHVLVVIAARNSEVKVERMRIVIGEKAPAPPAPTPAPTPPAPVPVPVVTDPLQKDLQVLYASEPAGKEKAVLLLGSVYGDQKAVADNAAQVLADLRIATKKVGLLETDLLLIRTRIGVELKALLPATSTTKIDDEGKRKLLELFGRLSKYLAALK